MIQYHSRQSVTLFLGFALVFLVSEARQKCQTVWQYVRWGIMANLTMCSFADVDGALKIFLVLLSNCGKQWRHDIVFCYPYQHGDLIISYFYFMLSGALASPLYMMPVAALTQLSCSRNEPRFRTSSETPWGDDSLPCGLTWKISR